MKPAKLPKPQPTIRFPAKLEEGLLTLPKSASAKLPGRGTTMIEATINGFPFRAALEPDGKGSHWLRVNAAMHAAAGAAAGDTVAVEITRIGDEPETRVPADLRQALAAAPRAQATWSEITPGARRDWILWLSSGKQAETRLIRIGKACSMLGAGKKRVCCFGGLGWLRKDHKTAGGTWLPLPKA
jgi:hypothetical protein